MQRLFDQGLRYRIVQAALGGGISGWELASAVSRAGGLGTVCIDAPEKMAAEIRRAKAAAGDAPVAANLIVPLTRPEHIEVILAERPAAVSLFFGYLPDAARAFRVAGITYMHQVGTADEAVTAVADGADVLIAQGREAGGHLLGVTTTEAAVQAVRSVARGRPVLAAGGVADASDVRRMLAAGADGVACGTRFLMSAESRAHPGYKARVAGAPETIETELFGLGWPARHRVVPNDATDRWCQKSHWGPAWVRKLNERTAAMAKHVPFELAERLVAIQSARIPLLSPSPPLAGMPDRAIEVSALYAGECASRVADVRPAAEIVAELARGFA